ncbi:MAG: hypothetical protein J6Y66_01570, partial [Bacteroidales bacterium]|nr:hypothetical protein [Bacteroidales bacterium]
RLRRRPLQVHPERRPAEQVAVTIHQMRGFGGWIGLNLGREWEHGVHVIKRESQGAGNLAVGDEHQRHGDKVQDCAQLLVILIKKSILKGHGAIMEKGFGTNDYSYD